MKTVRDLATYCHDYNVRVSIEPVPYVRDVVRCRFDYLDYDRHFCRLVDLIDIHRRADDIFDFILWEAEEMRKECAE